jgi:hypothetical protein
MKTWLLGILGILGSIVGIFFYGRKSGRGAERAKQTEEVLSSVEESTKAKTRSASMDTDRQLDELHDDIQK